MYSYQITIKQCGIIQKIIEFVTASSALEAINFIETNYKPQTFELSEKKVSWSGYEFEARQESFVLS